LYAAGIPTPTEEVRRYFAARGDDATTGLDDPLELRRRNDEAGMAVRGPLEPVGSAEDELISGVRVRRYRPRGLTSAATEVGIIWLHGGAWFHGTLEVYDGIARALAVTMHAEVVAVDYRLAPEHPFPAGLDDVWTVLGWARERFDRVVLAGDSSGGNLAAATALRARDAGVDVAAQLLIYPVLDADETDFKKDFRARYTPFLNQAAFGTGTYDRIIWIWDVYAPDPALRDSPAVAPMRADSLRGVAPAVILTAEHDILRGEAEAYAQRLREDAVPVEVIEFPGQIHGFLQMRGVFAEASRALVMAAAALRRVLDTRSSPTI
jgi:acetyl esterase